MSFRLGGLILPLVALVLVIGCGPMPDKADNDAEVDSGSQPARKIARAGVGKQGQSLSGKNILSVQFNALFNVRQQVEFMKTRQALEMYRATHGHFPKSHEEFMTEIIEPNMIQLPELPAGERYQFDPDTGELMVEPIPDNEQQ